MPHVAVPPMQPTFTNAVGFAVSKLLRSLLIDVFDALGYAYTLYLNVFPSSV